MSYKVYSRILTAGSSDDFRLRAFKDYVDSKNQSYQQVMAAMSQLIEDLPDTDVSNKAEADNIVDLRVNDIIANNLQQLGFDANDQICFDEGYTTLQDLLKSVGRDALYDMNGIDQESNVSLKLATGAVSSAIHAQEAISQLKTNLHSAVCLAAACEAMNEKLSDIAGRLTVFNAKIKEVFENEYNDLSNTGTYLRDTVLKASNVSEFFQSLSVSMGVSDLAEESSNYTVGDTDIHAYCGASPMNALASGAAKGLGLLGYGINVGCKVVSKVFTSIFNFSKKVFAKVGSYAEQIFENPYDLKVVDEKASSYTVDGFTCNMNYLSSDTNIAIPFQPKMGLSQQDVDQVNTLIQNDIGKWFKFETLGAENILRFNSAPYRLNSGIMLGADFSDVQIATKPKSVNPSVYNSFIDRLWSMYGRGTSSNWTCMITPEQLTEEIERLKNMSELYISIPASESEQYAAFNAGYALNHLIIYAGVTECNNSSTWNTPNDAIDIAEWVKFSASTGHVELPQTVTNQSFAVLLSGGIYYNDVPKWDRDTYGAKTTNSQATFSKIDFERHLLCIPAITAIDKETFPLDWTFIPFRVEKEGWASPRFAVKTDYENLNALENAIAVAVVVVVVAIVAWNAIAIIKRIARASYFRRARIQGSLDAKLWNGQRLTPQEQKRYVRAAKKMNKSNLLGSGLQSSASSITINTQPTEVTNTLLTDIANTIS